MKQIFPIRLGLLCVLAYAAVGCSGQEIRGTISGTVLDAASNPVSKVGVHAELLGGKPRSSIVIT